MELNNNIKNNVFKPNDFLQGLIDEDNKKNLKEIATKNIDELILGSPIINFKERYPFKLFKVLITETFPKDYSNEIEPPTEFAWFTFDSLRDIIGDHLFYLYNNKIGWRQKFYLLELRSSIKGVYKSKKTTKYLIGVSLSPFKILKRIKNDEWFYQNIDVSEMLPCDTYETNTVENKQTGLFDWKAYGNSLPFNVAYEYFDSTYDTLSKMTALRMLSDKIENGCFYYEDGVEYIIKNLSKGYVRTINGSEYIETYRSIQPTNTKYFDDEWGDY